MLRLIWSNSHILREFELNEYHTTKIMNIIRVVKLYFNDTITMKVPLLSSNFIFFNEKCHLQGLIPFSFTSSFYFSRPNSFASVADFFFYSRENFLLVFITRMETSLFCMRKEIIQIKYFLLVTWKPIKMVTYTIGKFHNIYDFVYEIVSLKFFFRNFIRD